MDSSWAKSIGYARLKKPKRVFIDLDRARGFQRDLLRGITEFAYSASFWEILSEDPEYIEHRHSIYNVMKKLRPDGIIIHDNPELKKVLKLNVPTVIPSLYNKRYPENTIVISGDRYNHGRLAAEHLLQQGYKKFAFFGYEHIRWSEQRRIGFCETVGRAGYKVHIYKPPKTKNAGFWHEEFLVLRKWLENLPKPVGIFGSADRRAQQVLRTSSVLGYYVPDQIGVLGVNNDELVCEMCNPPLSSIALNGEKAGFDTAKCLDKLMNGQALNNKSVIVEPKGVVQRLSSNLLQSEANEVLRAMEFIQRNALKPISVNDVIENASVSRRELYHRFKRIQGLGIKQALRHVRVSYIEELLRDTNLTISEISYKMQDVIDPEHFSRYFKAETGMSPTEYRKRFR